MKEVRPIEVKSYLFYFACKADTFKCYECEKEFALKWWLEKNT